MRAILLAAGLGTRLRPLTDKIPKCLAPINGKPLLGYWLEKLEHLGVERILINTHHHPEQVEKFIRQTEQSSLIESVYEPRLLGTAGTIRENKSFFSNEEATIVVHADNFSLTCLSQLKLAHKSRLSPAELTMLTFETENPCACGIVTCSESGLVTGFYEKVANPPGNLANGAVYIFEPSVIQFIAEKNTMIDISNDVLPQYIGRIYASPATGIHIDIGTQVNLDFACRLASGKGNSA